MGFNQEQNMYKRQIYLEKLIARKDNGLIKVITVVGVGNHFYFLSRKYISTPLKYYFADTGLRNALLNFRQTEENHLMENIIFNELKIRSYDVDVSVVEIYETNKKGSGQKKQLEIDFVANKAHERIYIQSALNIADKEKADVELRPFLNVNDSFKKIILVNGKDNEFWDTTAS